MNHSKKFNTVRILIGLVLFPCFYLHSEKSNANKPPADTTLKVAIYNFKIETSDKRVALSWQYFGADSNTSFVVERSTDNQIFSVLSITPYPVGSTQVFFYNDQIATAGIYYYRVKEYGNFGGGNYSETKQVSINDQEEGSSVKLSRSNGTEQGAPFTIDFGNTSNSNVVIQISDTNGRLIYSYSGKASAMPPITNLSGGIFFINAAYGRNSYAEKFAIP